MSRHRMAWVLVPTLAFTAADPAEARARAEPSPVFTGQALPEPPRQNESWTPPPTRLLAKEVAAARLLFAQGLADPRGCAYREVTVATGSCWTGDAGTVTTHGWVLPGHARDGWHFCVCWNGLLYPAAAVGPPADLRADVQAAARQRRQSVVGPEGGPSHPEGRAVWHRSIGAHNVCLLLRLGEGALADELVEAERAGWEAYRKLQEEQEGRPRAASKEKEEEGADPYPGLADVWCWNLFDRGLGAHMRGDERDRPARLPPARHGPGRGRG